MQAMVRSQLFRVVLGFGFMLVAAPRAEAGGYGGVEWGETLRSALKKLKERQPRPRTDLEPIVFEDRVLREERDEKVRVAIQKKRSRADIARLRKLSLARARFAALYYWVDLGPLDGKVVLSFLDDKLTSAEVDVLYQPSERGAAAELLDLVEQKYGAPKEHRGDDKPGAPAVDIFEAENTRIEAYQQPAVAGRGGLLRLTYRNPERALEVDRFMDDLHNRLEQLEQARHTLGPTPEERDAARKAALMRHL